MTTLAAGLDIGGTKLGAALVERSGAVRVRRLTRSPADAGPEAMIAAATELMERLTAAGRVTPVALGVATAGVVDVDRGVIRSAGATIRDWAGTQLGSRLAANTGLATVVHNDVNAIAVAEIRFGAARGADSALVVAFGTGVGGALVIGGRVHRGRTDTAGEFGHLTVDLHAADELGPVCNCGARGHLETLVSGPAIAGQYARAAGLPILPSLEDVGMACRRGEQIALHAVGAAGALAGRALAGLVNAVDPDVVVLVGGVLGLGRHFVDPVIQALRESALPGPSTVPVRLGALGPDAGVVGAAVTAFDHVLGRPQPCGASKEQ
ncbi:MAG: ROK family protein [Jatrophihabitantaceae bacterium]